MKLLPMILIALLAACSAKVETGKSEPAKVKARDMVRGEFKTKVITLTEHERVRVIDLPGRTPTRCWVYINDSVKSSQMHCDDDGVTPDLPTEGPQPENARY